MKRNTTINNGKRPTTQGNTPETGSADLFKAVTIEFVKLDTNRERVANATGIASVVIRWAFEVGKSPRAQEVRQTVLDHLEKLRREKAVAA